MDIEEEKKQCMKRQDDFIRNSTLRFNENLLNGITVMLEEGTVSNLATVAELVTVLKVKIKELSE